MFQYQVDNKSSIKWVSDKSLLIKDLGNKMTFFRTKFLVKVLSPCLHFEETFIAVNFLNIDIYRGKSDFLYINKYFYLFLFPKVFLILHFNDSIG